MNDPSDRARRAAEVMWDADAASKSLGMELVSVAPGSATLSMRVTSEMVNGLDVCHGGLIFTLADSAMAFASNSHDDIAFAVSADMTWLKPGVLGDMLTARASEQARVGRRGVYDVEVHNQEAELVAVFRGRVRSSGRRLTERQPGV